MKQNDFDKIHKELGYEKLKYINESKYTDFQLKMSSFIKNNNIWDDITDRELYWFSFQKSNLDFSKFPLKYMVGKNIPNLREQILTMKIL